jgi:hypothetical protein
MDIPIFNGGWSYTQKEMIELFKHIVYTNDFNILEFGSGDSTVKLYNHFKKYTNKLLYYCYESDPTYKNHIKNEDMNTLLSDVNMVFYNDTDINSLSIPNIIFDLILIDGPNGDKRALWYSKIKNNVKEGTIILVDDFNHYLCFSEELDKNFDYELLSFSNEPFVIDGEHSWKIVKIIKNKN